MRVAVTFCNQRFTPDLSLLVVDNTRNWVSLPLMSRRTTGASGLTMHDGRLIVALQGRGARMASFGPDWDCRVFDVAGPRDVHDLASDKGELLIASSGDDRTWIGNSASDPYVLWKASELDRDEHHVNGITRRNGRTMVTMFGAKNGRRWSDVIEGSLVEVGRGVVSDDLYHPHSPRLRDDQLWVCDSGRGEVALFEGGRRRTVAIGGYTRGLCVEADRVLVGVSSARGRSRSEGTTNLVSDTATWCGIVVVDRHRLTIEERIDLTGLGGEIFDVLSIESFTSPPPRPAYRERSIRLGEVVHELESKLEEQSQDAG